jgi:hypothetical protein
MAGTGKLYENGTMNQTNLMAGMQHFLEAGPEK